MTLMMHQPFRLQLINDTDRGDLMTIEAELRSVAEADKLINAIEALKSTLEPPPPVIPPQPMELTNEQRRALRDTTGE